MDLFELKQALALSAPGVAQHLLPNGRKEGAEWRCGSVNGEAGKSLAVHLSGVKAGIWADFNSGVGGDLIDLWSAVKSIPLRAAISEAKEYLGISEPTFTEAKVQYRRPKKPACRAPEGLAKTYLQGRGITPAAIEAYKVAERDGKIVFPFLRDGELLLVKERDAMDGAKPIPTESDCEATAFGWQVIDADAREVVICEGELDALTLWDYGYPALSVPFGGGGGEKQKWIANDYAHLEQFETIYLCMDQDPSGAAAVEEICRRLGEHRCRVVELPEKDANDCLKAGHDDIREYFERAQTRDPEELRPASDYFERVLKDFYPDGGSEPGYALPWNKVRGKFHFRPAEMTVWQGSTNMGKSMVLSHVCVDAIRQGARICIASLEMQPTKTIKRMAKQAGQTDRPTEEYLSRIFRDVFADRLWLFDLVGKAKADRLLEIFEYARRRYGVDMFVVDSFMRLGINRDDYEAQAQAVFKLVDWAVSRNVHIHLVAHSRKTDGGVPMDSDIRGAGELADNAANIISVWWNKKRDVEIDDLEQSGADPAKLAELKSMPGVVLSFSKQRDGNWTGRCGLHYDPANYQYWGSDDLKRNYVGQDESSEG